MEGRLKKVLSKGFGFIDSNGIDFFFHYSEYNGDWEDLLKKFVSLEEGHYIVVEFRNDLEAPQGPRALNVKIKGIQGKQEKVTKITRAASN